MIEVQVRRVVNAELDVGLAGREEIVVAHVIGDICSGVNGYL